MSAEHHLRWSGHPNIYNNYSLREFDFYFSEPENGPNEDTGILLLISGFGGHANSNVYKKMRREFADQYNLIVVQCDFFGSEFMQTLFKNPKITIPNEELNLLYTEQELQHLRLSGFNISDTIRLSKERNINLTLQYQLEESIENFNDMSIMQALDNLTAVCYVLNILKDNKININSRKIIAYGQSHGSYLAYLCNALVPDLFTMLIDNSAWCYPVFLDAYRTLYQTVNGVDACLYIRYLATKMKMDRELLDLNKLYAQIDNHCKIISYHGIDDTLVSPQGKKEFCSSISNCEYYEINAETVDGKIFKSSVHGLDADFLHMFDHVMKDRHFDTSSEWRYGANKIITNKHTYAIIFEEGVPLLSIT